LCSVDYDEKAEDAVDYEDIDEQYDGPEVEAATEEDHLLSKKDYFSSNTMFASVNSKVSVFDEENYDEDEEPPNDVELPGDNVIRGLAFMYSQMFVCLSSILLKELFGLDECIAHGGKVNLRKTIVLCLLWMAVSQQHYSFMNGFCFEHIKTLCNFCLCILL
jgi:hypothetical protein